MSTFSDFITYVFEDKPQEITYYSHRTKDLETARQIIKEGLIFTDSFQKTTDLLINDEVHIKYWQNHRKEYGNIVVVIGISTALMKSYQHLLNTLTKKNYEVQQVLTLKDPVLVDDSDDAYTLPVQFIKGIWEVDNGLLESNKNYDPTFDSPVFKRNIDNILIEEKTGFSK